MITQNNNPKGFSLVELSVSLIVISLLTASFAPVITKRLSKNNITIASSNATSSVLTKDICSFFDNKFWQNGQCKSCSEIVSNCNTCDSVGSCSACKTNYYLQNNQCSKVTEVSNCALYSDNEDKCLVCKSGYSNKNNTCKKDDLDPPQCATAEVCSFDGDMAGDWIFTIKSTTQVNFPSALNVDIFAVGGGGSGGRGQGGGAGGGYVSTQLNLTVNGLYNATIGAGGLRITSGSDGNAGGETKFSSCISAKGGAGGKARAYGRGGADGGSGGGGTDGGVGGTDGGDGTKAGYGKGIKTLNNNSTATTRAFSEASGELYAGGGGGNGGAGGDGGGGAGGYNGASDGIANTGGGGGGCYDWTCTSGGGGSGVILIRNARCAFCSNTVCAND